MNSSPPTLTLPHQGGGKLVGFSLFAVDQPVMTNLFLMGLVFSFLDRPLKIHLDRGQIENSGLELNTQIEVQC
jgi:hypothetical protein